MGDAYMANDVGHSAHAYVPSSVTHAAWGFAIAFAEFEWVAA